MNLYDAITGKRVGQIYTVYCADFPNGGYCCDSCHDDLEMVGISMKEGFCTDGTPYHLCCVAYKRHSQDGEIVNPKAGERHELMARSLVDELEAAE